MPIEISAGATGDSRDPFLAELGFRTESYVNSQNKIDWYAAPGDEGVHYLALRFHQDEVSAYGSQRIQFYLSLEALLPLLDE